MNVYYCSAELHSCYWAYTSFSIKGARRYYTSAPWRRSTKPGRLASEISTEIHIVHREMKSEWAFIYFSLTYMEPKQKSAAGAYFPTTCMFVGLWLCMDVTNKQELSWVESLGVAFVSFFICLINSWGCWCWMCLLVSQLLQTEVFWPMNSFSDSFRLVALGFACLPDSSKISTATMTKQQHFFAQIFAQLFI